MARLSVLSPLPPLRSDAAMAGSSLVRLLGRLPGHQVSAPWPLPESVEALLGVTDLPIYHAAGDPEAREVYELAVERPGLVVFHDLALHRVIRAGMAAHDPVALDSAREALRSFDLLADVDPGERLRTPWCSYLLRRARGVVVHSGSAARYLRALGTRTPTFVAPPPAVADRRHLRGARRRARRIRAGLGRGPVLWAVGSEGVETAVRVAERVAGRVVVAGSPDPGQEVEGPVSWTGPLPARELVAWLAASDAVMDLRGPPTGSIPTPVVRALQLGRPVVTTSAWGVPDDAEGVTIIETPDVDAVADAVERALADPAAGERSRRSMERAAAAAPDAYRRAVDRTLALIKDPVEWTLARWADALLASGVTGEWVGRGYGTGYTDALEELRPS